MSTELTCGCSDKVEVWVLEARKGKVQKLCRIACELRNGLTSVSNTIDYGDW